MLVPYILRQAHFLMLCWLRPTSKWHTITRSSRSYLALVLQIGKIKRKLIDLSSDMHLKLFGLTSLNVKMLPSSDPKVLPGDPKILLRAFTSGIPRS